MIIVQLCGGLGNQMFQYALGRRLAFERSVPLLLDTRAFESDPLRDYRLDHLQVQASVLSRRQACTLLPWPQRLPRIVSWLPRWPGKAKLVRERDFPFDPYVLGCPPDAYLTGYWQTEKYFAAVGDQIRADFQLVRPMASERAAIAEKMQAETSVSVHVRRGDYVANPVTTAYHGVCSVEWYRAAMKLMADRIQSPSFYVFTDDPAWVRENMPRDWPITFIDPSQDGKDYEDLHLMARCKHHITANSSFSWWGAWLNPSEEKNVIVPSKWFDQAKSDTRDLIPDRWTRL